MAEDVWVPDITHEAMRDLVRARICAKKDTKVAKQRIQSILSENRENIREKMWTVRHRIWIANQSFPLTLQQIAYEHYRQSLEQIESRIE